MGDLRWLIMPVEVKHREFLSRIILASAAVSRGFEVLLGKDTMIRRLAPALPNGIIFDKSLGTARHGKPQRFARIGHKVAVLDEESTGYYGSPEQFLSVRLAQETLNACSRWYCISDKLRSHAASLYPSHQDKFVTSGLLRTDSWRDAFHGFYEQERKHISEQIGPFILFNSNFGGIIHARGDAFVRKQIRGQKKAYAEVEDRMAKIFEEGKPNLDAFIEILPKVADWFPNHRIVIRPHPSETIDFWTEKFGSNERFLVSNDGVATPWILASDVLFHHGCTTGIEATILNKPNVMYAAHPDTHHDTEVMESFVPIVKSQSELQAFLTDAVANPKTVVKHSNSQEQWYSHLEGKLACETILDDLEKLAFPAGELPKRIPLAVQIRIKMAEAKRRSGKEKAYMKQKWPGTSVKEITSSLEIASKALGSAIHYKVEETYPEVFRISAKR